MQRRNLMAALAFLLCATASSAAQRETLVVPPYPAATPWKVLTDQRSQRQVWIEWIPANQTEADIKDILTEQIFFDLKKADPSAFVSDLFRRVAPACSGVRVNGPKRGTENGYPTAYGQVYCVGEKNAGKDVDIFIKAIGGHDGLYVVQREFRRPGAPGATPGITAYGPNQLGAMKATMAAQSEANRYLADKVKLCAAGKAGAACAAQRKTP